MANSTHSVGTAAATRVKVVATSYSGNGAKSYSGLGFTPRAIIFTTSTDNSGTYGGGYIGTFHVSKIDGTTVKQGSYMPAVKVSSNYYVQSLTSSTSTMGSFYTGADSGSIAFTSIDSDGFTLTISASNGGNGATVYVSATCFE